MKRREFLATAGAAACSASIGNLTTAGAQSAPRRVSRSSSRAVVIGAGAFGGWTALYLLEQGFDVTLVDAYGPGNVRATSGDETR